MKQGSGSNRMSGGKVEPSPHGISLQRVSRLGNLVGTHVTGKGRELRNNTDPMHAGRGYKAPKASGKEVHKGGTQGRY